MIDSTIITVIIWSHKKEANIMEEEYYTPEKNSNESRNESERAAAQAQNTPPNGQGSQQPEHSTQTQNGTSYTGQQYNKQPPYGYGTPPYGNTPPQQNYGQPYYQQFYPPYQPPQEQKANAGLAVLSWFIPLAGLIIYLTEKETKPKTASACGKCALASFIINTVLGVILYVVFFVFWGTMFSNAFDYAIDSMPYNSYEEFYEDPFDEPYNDFGVSANGEYRFEF